MKFSFVLGFILLILFIIGIFVGLPYLIQLSQLGSISLKLPLFKVSNPQTYNQQIGIPPTSVSNQGATPNIKIGESLYKGKVSFGINFFGSNSISLRASYFSSGAVDITGWRIKSANRGETIIGKGIGLPQFDSVQSDIWLRSGDAAYITIGLSPLSSNFRANNCFGWLNNLYNFGYSLNYCPGGFSMNDLAGLDSICQDLILHSGYCHVLSDNDLNRQSGECREWAEKNMNYNSCVIKYRNDSNFYKEWRIYTGNNNQIFDPRHDKIELRDQAGLLVDSYEY